MFGVVKHIKGVPGDIANVYVREASLLPVIYQSVKSGFQAGGENARYYFIKGG